MDKKKKMFLLALAGLGLLAVMFSGCGKKDHPSPKNPVTLTLWHTYVEQMKTDFDELVDEFNSTVGAQKGININTTSVANAPVLNEKLIMAANGDPGAPALPDIALVYPKIAVELAEKDMLMDFSTQFSEKELSCYVPEFLEEGRLGGETLYLLPIAKSTEVLYVNTTIFDRFAKDTGVTVAQLATFEGILDAAEKYYAWTDAKTPDIEGDGKTFYYPDALFNYTMIGFQQMGDDFLAGRELNLSSPVFQRIWNSYYPYAVRGSVAVFDNYGNYLAKTGDIVCTTSTSAGVIYYPESITYADNTKEDVEFAIMPYPIFEGGEKIALQRGGGMCVIKSDSKKEYAAGVFLKWLTEPKQNLKFTARTGYIPVTEAAFGDFIAREMENINSENVKKLLETVVTMQNEYIFYVPPVFNGFDELQSGYTADLRKTAEKSRRDYQSLLAVQDPGTAYESAAAGAFERFIAGH